MDRFDAKILATWIKNNLDGCADPRAFGKGLTANRSGEWRYRVGSYRILAFIHDDFVLIEALLRSSLVFWIRFGHTRTFRNPAILNETAALRGRDYPLITRPCLQHDDMRIRLIEIGNPADSRSAKMLA